MQMQITFKSGAQIAVDVTKFSTKRSGMGGLQSINWTTPPGAQAKLHTLELDEVAAIVALYEDGDDDQGDEDDQAASGD